MSDPFQILGAGFEVPPSFADAHDTLVEKVRASTERFEALQSGFDPELATDEEWRAIETTLGEMAEAAERAEEGYLAVQYDGHAWYRIMESLERLQLRTESAIGLMERAVSRAEDRDRGA